MPILVDFNQIAISNLMINLKMGHINEVDESMLRHMILNSLRGHRSKFHEEYGELIICCDGRKTWRKEVFPYYKQRRKTNREASGLDWNQIFGFLNTIIEELNEHFPYKVVHLESAEADDIIGVLARNWIGEKVLVLSGDKDFMQLQTNENIKQYSPVLKKFLRTDNPKEFLFEHIVRGDVSDGIPNCLSKDSTFVTGERQVPVTKKRLEEWMKAGKVNYKNGDVGFDRNQRLIDLSFIPYGLQEDIIDCYDEAPVAERRELFGFFVNKKLKRLMENIQEF